MRRRCINHLLRFLHFNFERPQNVKAVAVSRPSSWEKRPEGGNPERKRGVDRGALGPPSGNLSLARSRPGSVASRSFSDHAAQSGSDCGERRQPGGGGTRLTGWLLSQCTAS